LDSSLELEGTAIDFSYQPDSEIVAPEVPIPEPEDSPNPSSPYFNYRILPRLTNFPSRVFNLVVSGISISINGVDYSQALYSLDWSVPINGVSQGSVTLRQTVGLDIDPDTNGLTQGLLVTIFVSPTADSTELLTRAYIIGNPSYSLNSQGEYELTIEIGDELSLLSNTTRNRNVKYCGIKPRNTQELAQIYSNLNGLKTRVFPIGHDVLEASVNNFLTETPHQFLSTIYSPVNRDVRCNPNGLIVFPIRPVFDNANFRTVSYKDVIESSNNFSQFYEPYSIVKASNNFELESTFEFTTRSTRQVQGNPENTKPWFQGGYQEIATTVTSLGDTDIHISEITYGYVPTEEAPYDKDLVEEDPCAIGSFTTVFDVIASKITALTYYTHPTGSKVVTRQETWENQLSIFKIEDEESPNFEDFDLFNGLVKYSVTFYDNHAQVNNEVCQSEWQLLATNVRNENYSINKDRVLVFNSWSQENYTSSGTSFTLGQPSYTGVGQSWVRVLDQGEFNENDNVWVIQPTQTDPNVSPPSSKVIKPLNQSITNFSEFSLFTGPNPSEPSPINAPFCYNKEQLDKISERFLREQYGLSKALVITVPFSYPLEIGESVRFVDRNNIAKDFIVFSKEINSTQKQVTKTLVLSRVYHGN
jgi:hypothetical protein